MRDILADRHRVKLNSLIGNHKVSIQSFSYPFFEFDHSDLILIFLTFYFSSRTSSWPKTSRSVFLYSISRSCLCRWFSKFYEVWKHSIVFLDAGNYDRCLALWKYALNRQVEFAAEPINVAILSSLHSFVDLFRYGKKIKFWDLTEVISVPFSKITT